ncbi:ATP-binding protein [Streptomyces sp. NPDC048392]|uniref:ATP-binding protein n=1 Tax=Streptomyces sp. NPDC048392 TaxID=3365543 RepID=UPI003711E2F7
MPCSAGSRGVAWGSGAGPGGRNRTGTACLRPAPPPRPGSRLGPSRARHHVRDTCRSRGLPTGTTDDLVAVTGELVANALEHTDSRTVTTTCALTAETVTVGVTDDGRRGGTPVIPASAGTRESESESEHGRGLLITAAPAARWGTRRTGGALTVWAEDGVGAVAGAPAGFG